MLRGRGRFSAFIIRLAIVATALSVAAMIAAVAMISGFKHEIRSKIFSYWGHVIITPYSPSNATIISPEPIVKDDGLIKEIYNLDGVEKISPFAVRPVILNTGEEMEPLQLKGVDRDYDFSTVQAAGLDFSDTAYSNEVILSKTTMNRLNTKEGEEVLLYFLEPEATFPRIRKVKVAGQYHTGMVEIDKHYAICDIRLLQNINKWEQNEINGYQLELTKEQLADTIANDIFYKLLPESSRLYPQTMQEIYPAIYDWLGLQDVNAMLALIIMAIVAVIDMIAALLILIVEQARLVGILKTLGMTNGGIRKVFLYHAAFIGGVGILLGNIIGVGLCVFQLKTGFFTLSEETYYMQHVPIKLLWWQPVVTSVATFILCLLCMLLPTLYIKRILPARVLQFK